MFFLQTGFRAVNSSFTGSVGLIIASSRSGTSFSSCLASSTYFSITKKLFFLWYNFPFVSSSPRCQPPPTHFQTLQYGKVYPAVWKSILPREWRIAIPASLMRVENASSPRQFHILNTIVHPHQRCGHSDSPFARIYFFLYCRV